MPETSFDRIAADRALTQAQWQEALFSAHPRRTELRKLEGANWPLRPIRVRVHRNQPFELVIQVIEPFLSYSGIEISQASYSAYDDALNFDVQNDVDLEIVSLDFQNYFQRFTPADLANWLGGRLIELGRESSAPILVTNSVGPSVADAEFNRELALTLKPLSGVAMCDTAALSQEVGDAFFDERAVALKGTNWSDAAIITVARSFGLHWIPAALSPPIKAVVVDLDNTFYGGVLGEDGVDGIQVADQHRLLHKTLLQLKDRGLLLAISSRNELPDVEKLFAERADIECGRKAFSSIVANWDDKAVNIRTIAEDLRIGLDAIAFLDDNAGELASVASQLPTVRCLHASSPDASIRALNWCPGLFRFQTIREDSLRAADLEASRERAAAANEASDPDDYLRSLGIELRFRMNNSSDLERVHSLVVKTNQFNTAVARTSAREISRGVLDGTMNAVVFELKDKLSDSGTIGVVLATNEDKTLVVHEICISCRALGRNLEDAMIKQALRLASNADTSQVDIRFQTADRNKPALDWLRQFSGQPVEGSGTISFDWNRKTATKEIAATPAAFIVEKPK